jgi:broad specificity phosphatase PhoE
VTKIYLVRHAEVYNPNHIYYVWLPRFFLSKAGYFQAEKLKDYFAEKKIVRIYSSPLLRTRKTAQIIADGKVPVTFSKKIIEANYSKWQGLKASARPYGQLRKFVSDPENCKLGEKITDVQKRMVEKILDIAKKHQGEEVIVVSHADPIIAAKFYFEERDLKEINKAVLKNASITSLFFDKELRCEQVEYQEIVPAKLDGV